MKKIVIIFVLAIMTTSGFSIYNSFEEAFSVSLDNARIGEELVISEPTVDILLMPISKKYIDAGWALNEVKEDIQYVTGNRALMFIHVSNRNPNNVSIPFNFIEVDGKAAIAFMDNKMEKNQYMTVQAYSELAWMLIVDEFDPYPVIFVGRKYMNSYYTINTSLSYIYNFVEDEFNKWYARR